MMTLYVERHRRISDIPVHAAVAAETARSTSLLDRMSAILLVILSTREHISGTTCPIYTNFCAYSLLLWLGPLLAVSA